VRCGLSIGAFQSIPARIILRNIKYEAFFEEQKMEEGGVWGSEFRTYPQKKYIFLLAPPPPQPEGH